jgi:myo-inositol-1(or 4)-monophosphatase
MDDRESMPLAPEDETLREIEKTAVDLARLAGGEIVSALGRTLAVKYKGLGEVPGGGEAAFRDPVSEVDHDVEALIRTVLAERFPEHGVLGEEFEEHRGADPDFVWAVDPVDGTANFVNGFPLFAASIGVLHRGRPVAGAVWCSATHALRPGIYHARIGGPLRFDEEKLDRHANPAVRRRLAGMPRLDPVAEQPWDSRKTGSAAIECAFVAAGLLAVARFERPNVWDVAGGLALVQAAGCEVRVADGSRWREFDGFAPYPESASTVQSLGAWRHPLALGEAEAVQILCGGQGAS